MNVTESAIQIVFTSGMQKYGGDDYVSVVSLLVTCMSVLTMPMMGICQGAQPITSYNYGAGNTARVRRTFRLLIACNAVYCFLLWGLIQLFPTVVIRLFSSDMTLLDIGAHGARIFLFGVITMFGQNACQNTFLALGEAKISMFCALLRKVFLLIPLALILPVIFYFDWFASGNRWHLPFGTDRRYIGFNHYDDHFFLPVPAYSQRYGKTKCQMIVCRRLLCNMRNQNFKIWQTAVFIKNY